MSIKILLYGYGIGIRSSRKIAEKNRSDIYFMYLSGNQKPDFRTISDFRLNKRKYIERCFNEVLSICKEMNLFSLGHVSIDGSKIKSNASKKKTKDREDILGTESKVKEILDEAEETDKQEDEKLGKDKSGYELPEELSSKEKLIKKIKEAKKKLEENKKLKRINLTDTDSRFMKKSDGGVDECYNSQLAVDSDKQIITAYEVTNIGNDNYLFPAVYEKIIENTKEKPLEVSADAGYYSGITYKYIENRDIEAYLPESRLEKESKTKRSKFDRRNFIYDKYKNEYICPEKERLVFKRQGSRNGIKFNIYQSTRCPGCKYKLDCISRPTASCRTIQIYENDKFKKEMREKLLSREGKKKYNIRLKTVEPVFAQIKYVMGFNRFLLRGLDKVKVEFSLVCTAYNIKKIAALQMA
jgi:transposase